MKSVAIVILNYNTRRFLEDFLPSVVATNYSNFKIVVADNASTDDSVKFIKNNYPAIDLIIFGKNHGFTGGYNLALQQVKADYYVLLNSDVKVHADWLQPLVELAESRSTIAAVQPKILSYHDPIAFEYAGASGGFIDEYGYPYCRGRVFETLEKDKGQYDDKHRIFWATGAAMLIKADAYHKMGGLDEDFFAHMEEIDLCWRLQNSGYEIWVEPKSKVWHVGGGTLKKENPRKTFYNYRNGLVLLYKNLPSDKVFKVIFMRLLLDHISAYRFLFMGKFGDFKAIAKAHKDFLFRLRYWRQKRYSTGGYDVSKTHLNNEDSNAAYNSNMVYKKSIVWQYFIKKKHLFSDL
ncbi:MAG: glycosyltransferase family 2 protein [Bacteroidota bacterium]